MKCFGKVQNCFSSFCRAQIHLHRSTQPTPPRRPPDLHPPLCRPSQEKVRGPESDRHVFQIHPGDPWSIIKLGHFPKQSNGQEPARVLNQARVLVVFSKPSTHLHFLLSELDGAVPHRHTRNVESCCPQEFEKFKVKCHTDTLDSELKIKLGFRFYF